MTPVTPSALDPFIIFVNVGYGIMLLGFVLRDVLKLRSAMIIGQILAKVPVDPITSTFFILISISGIILAITTLRSIRDR